LLSVQPAIGSNPIIVDEISGVELCPQSACGAAIFTGTCDCNVNNLHTLGFFRVAVQHGPWCLCLAVCVTIDFATRAISNTSKVLIEPTFSLVPSLPNRFGKSRDNAALCIRNHLIGHDCSSTEVELVLGTKTPAHSSDKGVAGP
jgi:hypothetical protein